MEDRRGMGTPLAVGGGIGGVVLLVLGLIFGVDLGGGHQVAQGPPDAPPKDDKMGHFVRVVAKYTEDVWTEEFAKRENGYGVRYHPPEVVMFSHAVDTGCGRAPSAVGPFYCPEDEKVYLDPTFFDELEQRLGGSKADFSKAYVIAHEVGHHVQKLLGYNRRVSGHDNQTSVRLELMADYLAGVWANHGQQKFHFLEAGDIESAITSAKAIGDDRLQKRSGGFVHPENFTHGTSRQRVYFFTRGFKTGDARKETLDKFFSVPMRGNGEIQDF